MCEISLSYFMFFPQLKTKSIINLKNQLVDLYF